MVLAVSTRDESAVCARVSPLPINAAKANNNPVPMDFILDVRIFFSGAAHVFSTIFSVVVIIIVDKC